VFLLIVVLAPSTLTAQTAVHPSSASQAVTPTELTRPDLQPSALVFNPGDVFVAVGSGKVKRFSSSGTLLQVLDTLDATPGDRNTAGMATTATSELLVTLFTDNSSSATGGVYKFGSDGSFKGNFAGGYNAHPESIAIDLAQNVYVGQADGAHRLLKFSPQGNLIDSYMPATESRGVDWIDVASDQRTLYYTSEGKYVKRYDLASKSPLSNFNAVSLPGANAYALRLLPSGGLLVADSDAIVRLNSAGQITQTYDAPGENDWFAVNLDPDGTTFWTGGYTSGRVYRFNISSGAVVNSWFTAPYTVLAGLAIFKEQTAVGFSVAGILAVVGSVQGNGAFFRTGVQIHNPRTTSITGKFVFHAQSVSGSASDPSLSYTLNGGQTIYYPDLLPAMGVSSGLGSLDIMTTGDPVPITAARVFSDAGTNGTAGFFIDPLAPEAALQAGDSGVIIAPSDPLQARLNLGVRSLETGAAFLITVRNKDGVVRNTLTKSYGATFFEQVNANTYVGVTLDGSDTITFAMNSGRAIIYGAQTDNKTQDPSVQYAKKTF
jgi:hypothetical protein